MRIVPVLVAAGLAVALAAPPAGAAAPPSAPALTASLEAATPPLAAFGRRSYRGPRSRYRYNRRPPYSRRARRPGFWNGFFGNVLRFLGIAYLVNLLFGWGPGGSPLGLLLLLAFFGWLALRRRRRLRY